MPSSNNEIRKSAALRIRPLCEADEPCAKGAYITRYTGETIFDRRVQDPEAIRNERSALEDRRKRS